MFIMGLEALPATEMPHIPYVLHWNSIARFKQK